ncbi:hypothetical protein SNE35_02500 [Paucibacter sp. R3-3]|uniref:Uncharacterized protein n=1 Tax=Roseateles agri TaxID=3098619 RepID=A0ABU5DC84_9BURK|nr:hypothetical protein [Paucibacter sp. R3-3]MDY0743355.1 hypothetical protein [Paucibacter sp. R3-3]
MNIDLPFGVFDDRDAAPTHGEATVPWKVDSLRALKTICRPPPLRRSRHSHLRGADVEGAVERLREPSSYIRQYVWWLTRERENSPPRQCIRLPTIGPLPQKECDTHNDASLDEGSCREFAGAKPIGLRLLTFVDTVVAFSTLKNASAEPTVAIHEVPIPFATLDETAGGGVCSPIVAAGQPRILVATGRCSWSTAHELGSTAIAIA